MTVFVRDGEVSRAVDVSVEARVRDLRAAADGKLLSFGGAELKDDNALLTDIGIGAEAVVQVVHSIILAFKGELYYVDSNDLRESRRWGMEVKASSLRDLVLNSRSDIKTKAQDIFRLSKTDPLKIVCAKRHKIESMSLLGHSFIAQQFDTYEGAENKYNAMCQFVDRVLQEEFERDYGTDPLPVTAGRRIVLDSKQ